MSSENDTSTFPTEQRAVIKHCANMGMTPTDTFKFVQSDKSKPSCSRALVFRWHKRFTEGVDDIGNMKRSGRPKVGTDKAVRSVREILNEDRRRTVREVCDSVNLTRTVVHKIMKKNLNLTKVSARWVPRLLSAEEKGSRVSASEEFFRRYEREGDRFLGRIVTTDETYISLYDPETKFESMVWKQPSSPPPLKAKTCRSTKKYMFIFFMDSEGMLLQHVVPNGTTVNAAYYQRVIRRDLMHAIRKKRPLAEVENLLFHQDNAPAHRSTDTLLTIDFLGFERITHAPYSPDIAPFDFAVFPRLKGDLRGKRFENLMELRMAVRSAVRTYDKTWYAEVYRQWLERHRKCVEAGGAYFEKQ